MGFLKAASVLLALASTGTSFPTWGNPFSGSSSSSSSSQDIYKNSVVESLTAPPRGWVKDESAYVDKDDAQIRLRMHLVNQDMDKFHELAMSVCETQEDAHHDHSENID